MRHNRPTGSHRPCMMAALTGIALTLSGQALASSLPGWQPQISEKILVLPQKQLERAIQRRLSLFHLLMLYSSDIASRQRSSALQDLGSLTH